MQFERLSKTDRFDIKHGILFVQDTKSIEIETLAWTILYTDLTSGSF